MRWGNNKLRTNLLNIPPLGIIWLDWSTSRGEQHDVCNTKNKKQKSTQHQHMLLYEKVINSSFNHHCLKDHKTLQSPREGVVWRCRCSGWYQGPWGWKAGEKSWPGKYFYIKKVLTNQNHMQSWRFKQLIFSGPKRVHYW